MTVVFWQKANNILLMLETFVLIKPKITLYSHQWGYRRRYLNQYEVLINAYYLGN